MKKIVFIALLLIFLIPLRVSANDKIYKDPQGFEYYRRTVSAFHTSNDFYINIDDPLAENYRIYFDRAEEIFESLHALTTNFDSATGDYQYNVFYINNHPNEWITIDPMLYDILEYALEMVEFTEGYFNISMGHIIDAWKEIINNPLLTNAEIEQKIAAIKLMSVAEGGIYLNEETSSVKIDEGVKIDLGALTKGYAVEMVYNYFTEVGLKYFRINGSQSSLKYGKHSLERDYYIIGISNPYYSFLNEKSLHAYVHVNNISLTTSGDTAQGFKYGDKMIHHIISPKTKQPENYFRLLTIAHPNAAFSDVLTTAMFSMDKATLTSFIKKLESDPNTKLTGYVTFGFTEDDVVDHLEAIKSDTVPTPGGPSGDEIINNTLKDWLILSAIVIIVAIGIYAIVESGKKKQQ